MSGTCHCRIQKQQHPSQWQPSIPIVIRINKPNFTLPSVPSVLICFLWTRELSQYSTIEWRNYCNISDSEQSYRTLCKLMPWCMQLNRECSSVTAIHYLQKEGMLVRGIRSKNGRHQSLMLQCRSEEGQREDCKRTSTDGRDDLTLPGKCQQGRALPWRSNPAIPYLQFLC